MLITYRNDNILGTLDYIKHIIKINFTPFLLLFNVVSRNFTMRYVASDWQHCPRPKLTWLHTLALLVPNCVTVSK